MAMRGSNVGNFSHEFDDYPLDVTTFRIATDKYNYGAKGSFLFFDRMYELVYVDDDFLTRFCKSTRMRTEYAKLVLELIGETVSRWGVSYDVSDVILHETVKLRRHQTHNSELCGVYRSEKMCITITPSTLYSDEFFDNFSIQVALVNKDGRLVVIS